MKKNIYLNALVILIGCFTLISAKLAFMIFIIWFISKLIIHLKCKITLNPITKSEKNVAPEDTLQKLVSVSNIIKISDIQVSLNLPQIDKLTKVQSDELVQECRRFGYDIEPNWTLTSNRYKSDDYVILFKTENNEIMSKNYFLYSLIFDLGFKLAISDNELLDIEKDAILYFIFNNFNLTAIEQEHLMYRSILLTKYSKFNISDIMRRLLSKINPSMVDVIAKFLIYVAAADGIIKIKEYNLLKKYFQFLNLSNDKLDNMLQSLQIENSEIKFQNNFISIKIDKEKCVQNAIDIESLDNAYQESINEEIEIEDLAVKIEQSTPFSAQEFIILNQIKEENIISNRILAELCESNNYPLYSFVDKMNSLAYDKYSNAVINETTQGFSINQETFNKIISSVRVY